MHKNALRIFWILSLGLLLGTNALANSKKPLDNAWKAFYDNDLTLARQQFTTAAKDPVSAAEAHLMLSLLATIDQTEKTSFKHFLDFYAASANPHPYTFALWNTSSIMAGYGQKSPEQVNFLEGLIQSDADGMVKAMSQQMLGYHYESSSKEEDAKANFDQTGSILQWQLAGEFDNISASGFDKVYGPESHSDSDHQFIAKNDAVVQWFDLPGTRMDRWVDFTYNFYTDDAIIYAQNFCKSPSDQIVQFRIGTSGSLKFYVNDQLLFSEDEERNNDLDTYIFSGKLDKGWNRILIKIGSSEINRSNFMLRITDSKGTPIPGLDFTGTPQPYNLSSGFVPQVVENFAETYFKQQIGRHPENLLNYILLAETYVRNDKTYEARKVIKSAQELAPNCSYLRWQLIQVYLRDGNRTDLSKELERLKSEDPDNPLAMELLYDEAVAKEDYVEAGKIVDKLEGIFGKNENVTGKRISLAGFNNEMENMVRLISDAYKEYPESYTFVLLKYSLESEIKKDKSAGIKVLKNFLKNNYSDDAVSILANAYLDDGDVDKGLEQMKRLIRHNPVAVGYYSSIANIYFQIGDYPNAEKYYRECLKIAPYIGSYHSQLGSTYEEMNQKQQAISAYKKGIELNPNDYESRKKLRKLLGEDDVFDYFDEPDIYEIFQNSPPAEAFPEDNSVILLDEAQNVVYKSGGSEERQILLVKVFNPSGIDTWKEYYIPYFNNQSLLIEKAEVIKQNGNKIAAETNDNQVIFTALEAGDAIHLSYRIENYYFGKLTKHFWDKHFFNLFYPSMHSKYSLLVEGGKPFNYKVLRSDLKPVVEKMDQFVRYSWERKDMPSIKYESYMPRLTDVGEILHISTFPDWDFISKWYSDISRSKAKSEFEVKELANEILPANTNFTERQKVHRIYDYIISNIRYSSVPFLQSGIVPQKATRVINTKIGDCKDVSTLFVALCNEVGVDAGLMLINTRDNGLDDMPLPSIAFNHCIATVNMEGSEYLVELTSDNLPFGSGHTSIHRSFGLKISGDPKKTMTAAVMDPPTRIKNEMLRTSSITFDGDQMTIDRSNIRTGVLASSIRSKYRDLGKETQEKQLLESISAHYTNIKLNHLSFSENLKSTDDSVRYDYGFTVDKVYTDIAGLSIFDIPFSDPAEPVDFISARERNYPVEYWKYSAVEYEREVIDITIPDGRTLSEIPKSVTYSCDYADYRQSYRLEGNKLFITREFSVKDDYIPLERFEEFRKFYANVVKADEQKLAWK